MLLVPERSKCEKHQKIVVSKDNGNSREHRAINPHGRNSLRHYKLDGELVLQEKCCDYLLINDSTQKAYLIELKGGNVAEAIPQLKAAEQKVKNELLNYSFFYRIIASKARTHEIKRMNFANFNKSVVPNWYVK